jgi:hypothetical protein
MVLQSKYRLNKKRRIMKDKNVERFHMKPNRITALWWKAQGLTKLADVHHELSYEEFNEETNKLWKTLAKEEGLDIHDKELYKEPMVCIPVDEHGNELAVETEAGVQYKMDLDNGQS